MCETWFKVKMNLLLNFVPANTGVIKANPFSNKILQVIDRNSIIISGTAKIFVFPPISRVVVVVVIVIIVVIVIVVVIVVVVVVIVVVVILMMERNFSRNASQQKEGGN